MKKLLALMLALIMVLSLFAGCAKTEEPVKTEEPAKTEEPKKEEPKTEEPAKTEETPSWKEEHPTWLCEEKTTLTVYAMEESGGTRPNMSNDLYLWQWLEEYTNVHIEWELGSSADYTTLISTKLASGEELADIMYIHDTNIGNDAGRNGLLIDLAPYLDTCFPNTTAHFAAENRDYFGDTTNPDGTFYGLRWISDRRENKVVPMYNTKWMEQLGLEVPTTLEELENVLRTMKAAGDLNGNGVEDEIIMSGPGVTDFYIGLSHAFGVEMLESNNELFSADENGTVYGQYTTENMKAMLAWLNQMYDEGILDSEFTINKSATMNEKVAADRVGVTFYYASYVTSYGNMTSGGVAEPYSEQYTMGVPLASEYNNNDPKFVEAVYYGGRFTGVSADCENPELAAKWLDVLFADPNVLNIRFYGKEGESFYWDENGEPQIIEPTDGSAWNIAQYGSSQINLVHMQLAPQISFSRGNNAPWWNEQYQVYRDGDFWMLPSIPKLGSKTEEEQMTYDLYWSEFYAGWKEYRDKFITGELDVEADWDSYISVMEGLGLHELEGVYQSIYDRAN